MNQYYPNLFSPIYIGKTRLKNRIVMSAMDTHMFAMDGTLTPTACAHWNHPPHRGKRPDPEARGHTGGAK